MNLDFITYTKVDATDFGNASTWTQTMDVF